MGYPKIMDGKLDPSFNTGADLRKLLRDPRQSTAGRGSAFKFKHAPGPVGLYTRAFLVVGVTICVVLGLFIVVSKVVPGVDEKREMGPIVWFVVAMGTVAGCIYLLAKLRGMLMETGGGRSGKPRDAYANAEPLPKDCGTQDDWRDINGRGWSFFAPLIAGAFLSRVLIGQLEPGRGALSGLLDGMGITQTWGQVAIGFGGLALLLYAMHRVLKRKAE